MLHIDRVEDNAFSLHDLYGHTQVQEPCPGIHEIYNYGRNILGHHFYILSLSAPFQGVEEKILIEILHFHLMTYVATPQHQNPCSAGQEINNFGRLFLGHHYYIFECVVYAWIFKEIHKFYTLPQITSPWGEGHEIYNFLASFPTDATYQIW